MDKNRSTRYTKRKWKAYEELTLADDFLFCKVMQNPKICKEVLERILGKEVTSISYPEAQHTVDITIEGKGIRLDIVVADSMGTYYDLEMQQRDTKELPKRMRYYTSAIDQELLKRSEDYHTLNDVVIIFICPFDLFGAGKAKYVIHSYTEDHYLVADGCTKVVLNAKGKADTKELQSFLDYLEGKQDLQDPLVQSLQEEQKFASQNAEWRADYMKLVARDMDQRAIGREEGLREGIFQSIRRLLANHIPAEEVKRLLDVTDEDIRMAQKK